MPSKKKKYNARFPAGRIKKIMQSDEEIGKVAQAVPVIISRTLELFVESLLTKTLKITNSRNAKTLSTSHMKQCIMSEQRFDFLRELVKNIPDINVAEEAANYNEEDAQSSPEEQYPDSDTPFDLSMPSTSARARATSTNGFEHTRSQSVNGGGYNSGSKNLQIEYDIVQRLQQHLENKCAVIKRGVPPAVKSSVIMHTTSLKAMNCEPLPAKLMRSESTPSNLQQQSYQPARQSRASSRHHHQQQPTAAITNTTTISTQSNSSNRSRQGDTAIPAPVVNFELPLKPVVKIDYSNLHIPQPEDHLTPLSAPPHLNSETNATEVFNFAAEPIINIDLSNIVTDATATANTTPAIATISIGPLPSVTKELLNSSLSSSSSSPPPPPPPASSNKHTTNPKARITPSIIHSHAAKTVALIPSPPKPSITSVKDSYCELDEDYDNI